MRPSFAATRTRPGGYGRRPLRSTLRALVEARSSSSTATARAVNAFVSAEIALASGDYATAAQIAHDALEGADREQLMIFGTDLEWFEGDALLRAGDLSAASTALQHAHLQAERLGSQRMLWLILWSLARLADAEGRASDGVELRRRARAIVEAIAESLSTLGLAESFKRTPDAAALLAETPA